MVRPRRKLPSLSVLVAGAVVALTTCGAGLRADEFLCEEAHAKLKDCCPAFATADLDYCTYEAGCGDPGKSPALTQAESQCVRASTCERLRLDGVCDKAATLMHRTASGTDKPRDPVCR